jgi:hypothetical protein
MALDITWTQAKALIGGDDNLLQIYFKGDTSVTHPNFDQAKTVAIGMMRTKITERYQADKFDAWTNPPDYVLFHLLSLMLGAATAHDGARADSIGNYAGIAAGWLDDVAASKSRIIELEAVTPAQLPVMDAVNKKNETRVFDASDDTKTFNSIFPDF